MKLFGIVICALIISMATEASTMQDLAKAMNIPLRSIGYCLIEHPLSQEQTLKLEHLFTDKTAFINNPEKELKSFDCFIACILEKSKIMQNDKISLDNFLKTAEGNRSLITDEAKTNMAECVEKANKEKGKCNIAYTFSVCLSRNIKVT